MYTTSKKSYDNILFFLLVYRNFKVHQKKLETQRGKSLKYIPAEILDLLAYIRRAALNLGGELHLNHQGKLEEQLA